jgi:hypothetical protein
MCFRHKYAREELSESRSTQNKRPGIDRPFAEGKVLMSMQTITACDHAREIILVECQLREAAKLTTDTCSAARLADQAIAWQRRRFAHEAACGACQRIEREAA